MREGLDLILVALLLSSAVLMPGLLSTDDVPNPTNVTGSATFDEAQYTGPAEIETKDAAMEILGPATTTFHAEQLVVERLERTEVWTTVRNEEYPELEIRTNTGATGVTNERYENATIQIEGQDDGELQLWPNASLGAASFNLDLAPGDETAITARHYDARFMKDEVYSHDFVGPLFALGHHTTNRGIAPVSQTGFQTLTVEGGIDLVADNATVTITREDGTTARYQATNGFSHSDPSEQVTVQENTLIVLSLKANNGTMDFNSDDIQSTFFAHEPEWTVNGTIQFDADEGRLQASNETRTLEGDAVSLEGETRLSLQAQKTEEPMLQQTTDYTNVGPFTGYEPPIESTVSGDADNVTVAGESLQPAAANPNPAIPEEITFWSKLVGLLLLAASVAKKFIGFLAPLAIENPLGNDRRKQIFEFLKEAGMAHRREIHRATGIPNASLAHHLKILREHNLVIRIKQNGYTVYFPTSSELTHEEMRRLAYLADPTREAIAAKLVEQGTGTQNELIEDADLSQAQISRQLSKLTDASLVKKQGDWPRRYCPSQLLRSWFTDRGDSAAEEEAR